MSAAGYPAALRPVRVSFEGMARPVKHSPRHLFVEVDGVAILLPVSMSVTVEEVQPPRTWTDGDVVQSVNANLTYSRQDGQWVGVGVGPHSDEDTAKALADGLLSVLRYQAGER